MDLKSNIFIAGHKGLVGSAIYKQLLNLGYKNIYTKNRSDLDLCNYEKVDLFFKQNKIDIVFIAAAKVGGILANNKYRADFIYENLAIQNNVIFNAYKYGVKKLIFLGSSCIYPKLCNQPIKENYLLTGELEYTNEPYAIAKIAGLKMCEAFNIQYKSNFISVMPTNLYGENDNFDLETSHVLPALIRKIYLAKLLRDGRENLVVKDLGKEYINLLKKFNITKDSVEIWGSGEVKREFLHVDDMARACVWIAKNVDFMDLISDKNEIRNTHINIGYGKDIYIKDLVFMIKDIIGFDGEIKFNKTKPDGTPKKLLDISKLIDLGFKPEIDLKSGIKRVFLHYKQKLEMGI